MKKVLILAFSVFLMTNLQAQISVLGGYSTFSADTWDNLMDLPADGEFAPARFMTPFSGNVVLGLNYSIPIPNVGMRLLPEINYTKFSSEGWDDISSLELNRINLNIDVTNIAFLLNTNIYLFNLEGDCDCPTFGKDGGFFEKGFHLQGGPGIVYSSRAIQQDEDNGPSSTTTINDTKFAFVAGVGLDIGLSDKFTVTPFARYKWIAPQPWSELSDALSDSGPVDENSNSVSSIEAGIKIGFRYKN